MTEQELGREFLKIGAMRHVCSKILFIPELFSEDVLERAKKARDKLNAREVELENISRALEVKKRIEELEQIEAQLETT